MPWKSDVLLLPATLLLTSTAFAATEADRHATGCLVDPNRSQKELSEKLDNCDSVLKPPRVGDSEIVEPAPSTGDMPVLKPGDLPVEKNP